MGGCASKPKGLKAEMEGVSAPEPVPEVVKQETTTLINDGGETKEITEVNGNDEEDKLPKVDEEDNEVDEKGNKRRSLNFLLNEIEEGKDSIECEKPSQTVTAPSEPKVEVIARESFSTDVIEPTPVVTLIDNVETEKKPVESAPAVVVAPVEKVEAEKKPVESAPAVVVVAPLEKVEAEKKPVESAPAVVVAPLEKVEVEKKPVESAPAVVAPLEKVETAKKIESAAPTVETVKPEEKVDAKKDVDVKATAEKASEVVIKKVESAPTIETVQPALPVSSSTADVKGVVAAESK